MMNCIPPPLLQPPLNNELLVNVDKIQIKKGTFPGSSLQAINPVFSVMLCMCACLA